MNAIKNALKMYRECITIESNELFLYENAIPKKLWLRCQKIIIQLECDRFSLVRSTKRVTMTDRKHSMTYGIDRYLNEEYIGMIASVKLFIRLSFSII